MYSQHQVPIITSTRACTKAIQEILQCPIVALDCEGVNLSKRGKLCLIQIATPKRVYLFDILKGGDKLFFDQGLRLVLENRKILKIVHDCRRDSEALYYQYGIYLRGVWDSQVAFAIMSQLKGSKTPYPVGLNTLFRVCGVEGNQFKDSVKNAMTAMKNFWEVRPLSRMMVDYAAGDVKSLLNVYSMITAELTLHAHAYDFKKMIEDYSKKYVAMNIGSIDSDSESDEDSGDDGASPRQHGSYNMYGVEFWDSDIGLGTRDIFEEYAAYEKVNIIARNASASVSEDSSSSSSSASSSSGEEEGDSYYSSKKALVRENSCDSLEEGSVEAEAAVFAYEYGRTVLDNTRTRYYVANNNKRFVSYVADDNGRQYQARQYNNNNNYNNVNNGESYYYGGRRRYY